MDIMAFSPQEYGMSVQGMADLHIVNNLPKPGAHSPKIGQTGHHAPQIPGGGEVTDRILNNNTGSIDIIA